MCRALQWAQAWGSGQGASGSQALGAWAQEVPQAYCS